MSTKTASQEKAKEKGEKKRSFLFPECRKSLPQAKPAKIIVTSAKTPKGSGLNAVSKNNTSNTKYPDINEKIIKMFFVIFIVSLNYF